MQLKVINPYDQTTIHELPYETDASLLVKVTAANQAFQQWSAVPLQERIDQVRQGLEYFLQQRDQIAVDISTQMGKPIRESEIEVDSLMERATYLCEIADAALSADILPDKPGFYRRIEHAPLGVVLNIAAWNYPLLTAVNVVIPALLAGNSVCLKHSSKTPLCGSHFEQAFAHLSVRHLVTNLILDHKQTQQIIQNPHIQYVAFTGSVPGGREIYQTIAEHRFIDVGLELGGKDPAYITADANLDFTVPNIVSGACYNAGQSCCAIERVYVHKNCYAEFLDRIQAPIAAYILGNPLAPETTMGPLASASASASINQQIQQALKLGAQALQVGHRTNESNHPFYPPTLLVDVPQSCELMQEETFGPVIPILRVDSDAQAIAHMNNTRYGLTASIWTEDNDKASQIANKIQVGTVYQNRCDYLDPALPWTGVNESGKGSSLSRYGFYHLTRCKSLHFRHSMI